MKALTIRQPWASLIVHGPKRIENRKTLRHYRGPLLIHAGAYLPPAEYLAALQFARYLRTAMSLQGGGIIGICDVVDCLEPGDLSPNGLTDADLQWWQPDCYGLVLANVRPLPFVACKGRLGLWTVPSEVMAQLGLEER